MPKVPEFWKFLDFELVALGEHHV